MSTLLTPIITQMELDRDRFKDLVNGDELVTVSLETRTEKSIAGQVKDRINAMAVSLTDAVADAQSAKTAAETSETSATISATAASTSESNAFSYSSTAEGARDQVISDKADIDSWRADIDAKHTAVLTKANEVDVNAGNVETWTGQAESYKNTANMAAVEATDAVDTINVLIADVSNANAEPIGVSPSLVSPPPNFQVRTTKDFYIIGGEPRPTSDSVKFSSRQIIIEEFDGTDWIGKLDTVTQDLQYLVDITTIDTTRQNRCKIEDIFVTSDSVAPESYTTRQGSFVDISFDSGDPWVGIDQPTVTVTPNPFDTGLTVQGSAFTLSSGTDDHGSTVCIIKDSDGRILYTTRKALIAGETVNLEEIDIPRGYLVGGREYQATIQYVGFNGFTPAHSPWSVEVSFTANEYKPQTNIVTQNNINVNDGGLFRIDRTTNPTITIDTPSSDFEQTARVYVYGTTGTITYPTVMWEGGTEPVAGDLGANWTLFEFLWVGDDWIGSIVSSG